MTYWFEYKFIKQNEYRGGPTLIFKLNHLGLSLAPTFMLTQMKKIKLKKETQARCATHWVGLYLPNYSYITKFYLYLFLSYS